MSAKKKKTAGKTVEGEKKKIRRDPQAFLRKVVAQLRSQNPFDASISFLSSFARAVDQPGFYLARMGAYDLDPSIAQMAAILLQVILQSSEPSFANIIRKIRKEATPTLEAAFRDTRVPDVRKLWLLPALHLCDPHYTIETAQGFFQDFEGATEDMKQLMIDSISDVPEDIADILDTLGFFQPERARERERIDQCLDIVYNLYEEANPNAAAALFGAAAAIVATFEGPLDPFLDLLDDLVLSRSERMAWHLRELAQWPALGELRRRASEALAAMYEERVVPRRPLFRDFSHGYITIIDENGMRNLCLFFRTPEGGMDAMAFFLSDTEGICEAGATFQQGTKLEEHFLEMRKWTPYAHCSLSLARELLADAWAIHEEKNRPFPPEFFLMRPYLGEEPIIPRRRTPNLGAYMMEVMERSSRLVEDSEVLAESYVFGSLPFTGKALYDFLSQHPLKQKKRLPPPEIFETLLREVVIQERPILLQRMAINLELESLAGRATQPLNQLAAKTWLALEEEIVPFHEVPYIRALAKKSIQVVSKNLQAGFTSHEEVFHAMREKLLSTGDDSPEEKDSLLSDTSFNSDDPPRKEFSDDLPF